MVIVPRHVVRVVASRRTGWSYVPAERKRLTVPAASGRHSASVTGGRILMSGFVHVQGTEIVDGDGRPLLLRGVGLGNWLLPEGYMWKFSDPLSSPRQIEAHVAHLIGPEAA